MYFVIFVALFVLNIFLDVTYFVRATVQHTLCVVKMKLGYVCRDAFAPVVQEGICLTTDLDFWLHMNNARYLREADFGRFQLWKLNGIWDKIADLKGTMTLGSSTIRYRKSLNLFDRYRLRTCIVCWDEKAFYVEQRFERVSDNFLCAVMYAKQNIIRTSPAEILRQMSGQEKTSPDPPADMKKWIEYNELSSQLLKKSS